MSAISCAILHIRLSRWSVWHECRISHVSSLSQKKHFSEKFLALIVFCDVRGVSVSVSSDLFCYTFRSNLSLSYRVILVLWNTAWFSVDVAARVRSCQTIFHLCSHYWWQLTNLLKSLQVLSCWKIRASICSFTTPKWWNKFSVSIFLTYETICPIYFPVLYRFSFRKN